MADATDVQHPASGESFVGHWVRFFTGIIGAKVAMALSGMGLWVFLIAHLAGNLTAFGGKELFNEYAMKLHQMPQLLWFVRICLIVGFPVHILTALRTAALNREARPVPYAYDNKAPVDLAAKTMLLSGLVVAAFVAYHLAHFTWRVVGGANAAQTPYDMLVAGFQQPVISLFYIVAQVLLAGHLSHGLYSMFQHLGVWGRRWTPWLQNAALFVGYGLCFAFIALPISVIIGVIKP